MAAVGAGPGRMTAGSADATAGSGRTAAVVAAYDARAAEYIAIAGSLEQMAAEDREVIAAWRDATTGPLLDAGCGPGHWTRFLADAGRDVVGVDASIAFIRAAQARFPGLDFQHGGFADLPVQDASVGGILAWYSLIHLDPAELRGVLAEFARALTPGGSLLIGYFAGEARTPFAHAVAPAWFWSADTLAEELDAIGLIVARAEQRDRRPGEASSRPHGSVTAVRG